VALATRPHLMLLDEPAVGMSPSEATALANVIRRIRDERGATIIIVEHNMHFMMGLAERIMAMNAGRKLAEGTPAEIRRDPGVIAAYLGA
jgi:branched-chain amino acid transport system ATP-binding protein